MSVLTLGAFYFILWWLCFFISLPFGVQSGYEAQSEIKKGHEPGAPLKTHLGKKLIFASVLAAVLLFFVQWGLSLEVLQNYWH